MDWREAFRGASMVVCLACMSAVPLRGQQGTPQGQWMEHYFPETKAGIPKQEAVRFELTDHANHGRVICVGPWYAGRFSARMENTHRYAMVQGTIRGIYRTEGLWDRDAAVFISWYKGGRRVALRAYPLPAAEDWGPFEVHVRHPPPEGKSLTIGVGLQVHTAGRAFFGTIEATAELPEVLFSSDPGDLTRPRPPPKATPSNRFRLAEVDDTWWFIAPDGSCTYSLGVDGMTWVRGKDALQQAMRNVDQARALGFNSMGGWTRDKRWATVNAELVRQGKPMMPAFCTLQSQSLRGEFDIMTDSYRTPWPKEHALPDPFDPRYEEALRNRVRTILSRGGDGNWMAGWFVDNEVHLQDLHRRVWSDHCSLALVDWLEKRYGTIGKLNGKWHTTYQSFENLRQQKPDAYVRRGAMFEDTWEFRREVIKQWVSVALRAIREEDPGRLIFCNRFARGPESDWFDLVDLFAPFDGIATNLYPKNGSPGLSDDEKQYLAELHRRTGKPVIVTEWSIPAIDSGLYDAESGLDWSFRTVVDTQQQRARQAARVQMDFANLPFVVGAHWFIWPDVDRENRRANRGLVKPDGSPWQELQDALRTANRHILPPH